MSISICSWLYLIENNRIPGKIDRVIVFSGYTLSCLIKCLNQILVYALKTPWIDCMRVGLFGKIP